jgi:hypothetical protein
MTQMQIEHTPWVGPLYEREGIEAQRVAVVAFSHFDGPEEDCNGFTEQTIQGVIGGATQHRFFAAIRNYFGYIDTPAFWERIIFFNCLPSLVGGPEQRHGRGTPQQLARVGPRFLEILSLYKPHKAIVFTAKGWDWVPGFDALVPTFGGPELERVFRNPPAGAYQLEGHQVLVFGLRHPERAPGDEMRRAVERIMRFRSADFTLKPQPSA